MSQLFELTGHTKGVSRIESVCDDFNRRYKNTYMQMQKNGEIRIIFMYGILHELAFRYSIPEETAKQDAFFKDVTLQPLMPNTGYYQTDSNLIFLQKKATKQYKRSLCSDAYIIEFVGNDHEPDIYQIKENYYPYNLNQLDADSPDIALSRLWACVYNRHRHIHELCYRNLPVATLDFCNKTITPTYPKITQELNDFCRKYTGNVWKTINIG